MWSLCIAKEIYLSKGDRLTLFKNPLSSCMLFSCPCSLFLLAVLGTIRNCREISFGVSREMQLMFCGFETDPFTQLFWLDGVLPGHGSAFLLVLGLLCIQLVCWDVWWLSLTPPRKKNFWCYIVSHPTLKLLSCAPYNSVPPSATWSSVSS